MSSCKKEYPQAEQSREMLAIALLKLMDNRMLKDISISELAETAYVSRRTFYRHFKTVDDVLNYHLEKIADDFATYFWNSHTDSSVRSIVTIYFAFWEQHKDFLYLLKKNNLLFILLESVMPAMRKNIRNSGEKTAIDRFVTQKTTSILSFEKQSEHMEYIFYFMSGGAFNLLSRWLESGAVLSTNEMGEIAAAAIDFFSEK